MCLSDNRIKANYGLLNVLAPSSFPGVETWILSSWEGQPDPHPSGSKSYHIKFTFAICERKSSIFSDAVLWSCVVLVVK